MTKYDPRKNAEGYNDPTPYAAEKHMMAQIRGKQARVAGGYFENIISASCDYYLSRGLAKIEKTPEPMKPLGAKNRKGQFLACYTKQAQPDYGGTLKGGRSIYFEAKHTDDERIEQRRLTQEQQDDLEAHHKLGAIAFVLVSVSLTDFYMKDLGASFDDAADAIRIGTGATGDALDGLLDDFDAVYKSVPTTMEDASKAIADYNTRLGLTGPQLQEISKQAIQVSDMLGDDLGSVIEESSQAFQQWNIDADDMGGAMDYIFKVSQSTGMGFTDLMADMQKFGPQLQEMGYSFETASALMGQLDKAGVNTDEVLGAMKKSVATLAKEGISASDGLAMYYEKIKNAGTAAEAASIASEIFGTRAGSTMAAAIRDGSLAVADLTAELQENGETIAGAADDTYDFAERLQVMKQGLEVALKPMANTVFDGLNKFMPTLQKLMEQITPAISKAVEAAAPFVDEFLTGAADALEDVLPLISQLAADLLPVLTQLMSTLLPPLLNLVQTLLPPLMQIVSAILPPIASLLATVLPTAG